MSDDDMSNEITEAWVEFTENNGEKTVVDILSAFNEDMEANGGMEYLVYPGVVTLFVIIVVLPVYICISVIRKKKNK